MGLAVIDNEEILIEQFHRGNEEAFKTIYALYSKRLYFFAKNFVQGTEDAEDITSEVFIKLWNLKTQFENLKSISAFLHKSVKNRCYDYLRHNQVKYNNHLYLMETLERITEGDFAAEMIQVELIKLIYEEVDKLPVRMKEVFLLSYKEGLKPAEIAERLSINVQTVKNQRINALNLLKSALKNQPLLLATLILLELDGKFLG